ncbi:hypothetical protein ER308_12315 [Egibacter rhizosphaerae]|uniref:HPr kinase/phosphorylase C-terminal domain-containing protein n=1 Tax=Egibacter rhizosphaerae TaxID=1670831 RepID=A0A411YGE2_9ACTN|nr:hypothetical protein [Egibacter rhizosphaerae]QBI20273.1 hypothetical protein ER308_12315 [Egibacter rhizosphaerae]
MPGLPARTTEDPAEVDFLAGPRTAVGDRFPEGEPVVDPGEGHRRFYAGARREDGYLLRFFNHCDVHVSPDLSRVEYQRDHNADDGLVDVLLAGTTLAFIASVRGALVLHASAVEAGGRALAFVGHSGMGKSTLAIASCAAGARHIAEDVLVVENDDGPRCLAGNVAIRLRKGSVSLLDRLPNADRITMPDGRDAVVPPLTSQDSVPLDTLVIPRPSRNAEELTAELMPTAGAMFRLINFPRVNGLLEPHVVQRQFDGAGVIARSVRVLVATVPWGPPFRDDLGERLLDLMAA